MTFTTSSLMLRQAQHEGVAGRATGFCFGNALILSLPGFAKATPGDGQLDLPAEAESVGGSKDEGTLPCL